jgi:hypothetical protein
MNNGQAFLKLKKSPEIIRLLLQLKRAAGSQAARPLKETVGHAEAILRAILEEPA